MNLSENIKKARKNAGITQKQLAECLQVYTKDVCRWETGERTPGAIALAKICKELKVSADEILELKEGKAMLPDHDTDKLNSEEHKFLEYDKKEDNVLRFEISGSAIMRKRKELHLTMLELSKQSGIPYNTLNSWEKEKAKPQSFQGVMNLLFIFNCPIEELLLEPYSNDIELSITFQNKTK